MRFLNSIISTYRPQIHTVSLFLASSVSYWRNPFYFPCQKVRKQKNDPQLTPIFFFLKIIILCKYKLAMSNPRYFIIESFPFLAIVMKKLKLCLISFFFGTITNELLHFASIKMIQPLNRFASLQKNAFYLIKWFTCFRLKCFLIISWLVLYQFQNIPY